jgi:ABC-type uncharacterized transport system auxiliary subunit
MSAMRLTVLMASLGISALLCAACVSGRPIHYYTLSHPATTAAPPAKPDGPVLLVGRIATPEALDDGRIRYRSGPNEVGAYEYHRWVDRPGAMVRDLLIETLRDSGKYRQVQAAASAVTGDYLIRGSLREFSEVDDPGIQSRVSLQLELVDKKTGGVVWSHDYKRDEPVNGKTMKEVVGSLDHNLQQVVTDAAGAIDMFLSNRK